MASLDRCGAAGRREERTTTLVQLLDGDEPDPFDEVETAERREHVRRAVDQLPQALKEVLLLVYYRGLKYREAAEVLSIPVGTVKSRLHAAVRKLDRVLTHTKLPGYG